MRIVRGILFALVVFVAFVAVGLMLLPKERIAKVASAEISKVLGREVTVTGDIGLSVWPVLGVKTGPVRVAGPDWDEAPLLQADALNIRVGAAAALRRQVDIRQIELVNPEINLITAKDGRASWTFGETVEATEGASSGVTPFSLARASVSGATVVIDDRRAGTREKITGLDAELSLPELSGPATLKASGVRGGAALEGGDCRTGAGVGPGIESDSGRYCSGNSMPSLYRSQPSGISISTKSFCFRASAN